jgi:hypothetical protein
MKDTKCASTKSTQIGFVERVQCTRDALAVGEDEQHGIAITGTMIHVKRGCGAAAVRPLP